VRDAVYRDGKWAHKYIYGMLADEWLDS